MSNWQKIAITNHITGYKTTLDNGLLVCLVPMPEFQEVHAAFTTRYGSTINHFINPETGEWYKAPNGVAHFLEHKMFDEPDGSDVFLQFSQIGAAANAFTSHEQTSYIFQTNQHVAEATKVLLDYVQTPYFTTETVEKEKGIIAQEINMYDDDFSWVSYRLALELAYPHHPVGIDIAGTVDSIYEITKDDLYTCYHTFYHPSNMQLVISGNFDLAELQTTIIQNQAAKEFAAVTNIVVDKKVDREIPKTKATRKSIDAQTQYVTTLYKDVRYVDNDQPLEYQELIAEIILDMLFADTSIYYDAFFEEQIIDSDLMCFTDYVADYAFLGTQVTTNKPNEFIELYKRCWYEGGAITEDNFNQVKKAIIGLMVQSQSTPSYITRIMTKGVHDDVTPVRIMQWLQELTFDEIQTKYQEIVAHLDDYLVFVLLDSEK